MSSIGVGPTSNLGESSQKTVDPTEKMNEIKIMDNQDMEDSVIDDNGSGAGHTIVTTIGGQNGEPKQDPEDSVIDDNGSGAGHTIVTTIGGQNGEPKQDPEDSVVIDDYGSGASHIIVTTIGGQNGEPKQTLSYTVERFVGQGSFGVVFQAKCLETGESVAIKKVHQSKRFKNRELQTLRLLDHENIVSLKHSFFSKTERKDLYLNLVLEFVPDTVHRVIRHYYKSNQSMPLIYAKLYSYQILRALSYIHRNFGVCHRDIKPQNLLVNLHTHQVKVCDFGSAKVLVEGQPNISYICSRYYRAPELLFGATEYTTAVDMWSAGCVLGELLLGQPLFAGSSALNQVVEIIKVLGTPTSDEIKSMNPNYTEFNFPKVRAHTLPKIFPRRVPPEAIDLVSRLLRYIPSSRWTALDALTHPFFDDLRYEYMRLPGGRPLPPLFNFSPDELKGVPGAIRATLIPSHIRRQRQENRE